MTDRQDHWSEANLLIRMYGKDALNYVSARVTECMNEGDGVGTLRWLGLYECLEVMLAEVPLCPVG